MGHTYTCLANTMTKTTTMSGSEVVENSAIPKSPPKSPTDGSNGDSVEGSPDGGKGKKNWLGKEKKRPRAEFRAEIDELKQMIAALESNLASKTVELNQYKDWMSKAPDPSKTE